MTEAALALVIDLLSALMFLLVAFAVLHAHYTDSVVVKRLTESFRLIAAQRGGELTSASGCPAAPLGVRLSHRGKPYRLALGPRRWTRRGLEVHFDLGDRNRHGFTFAMRPRRESTPLGYARSGQEVLLGAPEFDDLVSLRTSSDLTVRRLLDKRALGFLLGFMDSPLRPSLALSKNELLVSVPDAEAPLAEVLGYATRWYDLVAAYLAAASRTTPARASSAPSPGAQPHPDDLRVLPAAQTQTTVLSCPVCGDGLSLSDATRCSSCGTPHHADCWHYNGRCAVYACSCTSSTPPPAGHVLQPGRS